MSAQRPNLLISNTDEDKALIFQLIKDFLDPKKRVNAIEQLSKKRKAYENLAPILWYNFGTVAAILQEIIQIYPCITPPELSAVQSSRVIQSISLIQEIAAHPETKPLFLKAQMLMYILPFLKTTPKTRPFEHLRLSTLCVLGALVRNNSPEVVCYILNTDAMAQCLRIVESGSELSKCVCAYVLYKIMEEQVGLTFVCNSAIRFSHVAFTLSKVILQLSIEPSARLLKNIIRCYERLSLSVKAREFLRENLPEQLRDGTFTEIVSTDPAIQIVLSDLMKNLA